MGIRFYCPNGHKLNVKDFQAGQTGVCPRCEAKLKIPLASTRSSSRLHRHRSKKRPADAIATAPGEIVATAPESPPASPAAGLISAELGGNEAGVPDPLAEAGDAVWYVRPSSGGQFGPANADILRTWLAEGRVSNDTLVWREGWRGWREAGKVFRHLAANQTMPDWEANQTMPDLEAFLPSPVTIPGRLHSVKRVETPRRWPTIVVVALAIATVAILGGLLAILLNQ